MRSDIFFPQNPVILIAKVTAVLDVNKMTFRLRIRLLQSYAMRQYADVMVGETLPRGSIFCTACPEPTVKDATPLLALD
jgi:hypothetical protein